MTPTQVGRGRGKQGTPVSQARKAFCKTRPSRATPLGASSPDDSLERRHEAFPGISACAKPVQLGQSTPIEIYLFEYKSHVVEGVKGKGCGEAQSKAPTMRCRPSRPGRSPCVWPRQPASVVIETTRKNPTPGVAWRPTTRPPKFRLPFGLSTLISNLDSRGSRTKRCKERLFHLDGISTQMSAISAPRVR